MNKLTVGQDTLLSTLANFYGFIVEGLYSNGMILKAAKGKRQLDSEQERINRLTCAMINLGIQAKITKLTSQQGVIEVMLK